MVMKMLYTYLVNINTNAFTFSNVNNDGVVYIFNQFNL